MIHIPLEILNLQDEGFHLLVETLIFHKRFKMVVDTGASRTVLDKSIVAEYVDEETLMLSDKLSTGLGTNTMESYTLTLPELGIGELHIPLFETAVLDLSSINIAYGQLDVEPVIGVIGGDILMNYGAVIDYANRVISFSKGN